jgi:hypothetical protein
MSDCRLLRTIPYRTPFPPRKNPKSMILLGIFFPHLFVIKTVIKVGVPAPARLPTAPAPCHPNPSAAPDLPRQCTVQASAKRSVSGTTPPHAQPGGGKYSTTPPLRGRGGGWSGHAERHETCASRATQAKRGLALACLLACSSLCKTIILHGFESKGHPSFTYSTRRVQSALDPGSKLNRHPRGVKIPSAQTPMGVISTRHMRRIGC